MSMCEWPGVGTSHMDGARGRSTGEHLSGLSIPEFLWQGQAIGKVLFPNGKELAHSVLEPMTTGTATTGC